MVIAISIGILIAAFIPGFVWLVLFLKEDIHPEPRSIIAKAFGLGALVTLPVFFIQLGFKYVNGSTYSNIAFFSILAFAFIEETLKFFTGYAFIRKKKEFDEPIDAMIYLIAIGLGFATIENLLIVFPHIFSPNVFSLFPAGETIALRFIGATLLHTLTGAIMGYYWARGIIKHSQANYISVGIIISTFIHFAFNYSIILFQTVNMLYPTIFLVAVAFFVLKDFEKIKERPLQ